MLHDHHQLSLDRMGREVITMLGVNGGILAWIHVSEAYSWTMKALQMALLAASVAYTIFRAGKAYTDWQFSRDRRAKAKKDPDSHRHHHHDLT